MNKIVKYSVFLTLICLFSNTISADLLDLTKNRINNSKPIQCEFIQQLKLNGNIELEESGTLTIKNADLIKWVYKTPDYKICVLKGNEVKLYDRDFDQLTIYKVNNKKQEFLWKVLFSKLKKDKIIENLEKRSFKIFNDNNELMLEVFLNAENFPKKVIQKDDAGYDRIIHFSNFKQNLKLKNNEFEIEIPAGTDIIELD